MCVEACVLVRYAGTRGATWGSCGRRGDLVEVSGGVSKGREKGIYPRQKEVVDRVHAIAERDSVLVL